MKMLENFLGNTLDADFGKLLLRLNIGGLMLFHGYKKAMYGIDGIKALVINNGFPELLAYGVYIGEIVVPILIVLGVLTRISSLIMAFNMAFAIYLAHSSHILVLNEKSGSLIIETPLLFLLGALALAFIGAGKYSFDRK
jgi:putative oxidoreductase